MEMTPLEMGFGYFAMVFMTVHGVNIILLETLALGQKNIIRPHVVRAIICLEYKSRVSQAKAVMVTIQH